MIPIFVFEGQADFTPSAVLAEQYVESIKAPRKEFAEELLTRVRPLAAGTGSSERKLGNKVP